LGDVSCYLLVRNRCIQKQQFCVAREWLASLARKLRQFTSDRNKNSRRLCGPPFAKGLDDGAVKKWADDHQTVDAVRDCWQSAGPISIKQPQRIDVASRRNGPAHLLQLTTN